MMGFGFTLTFAAKTVGLEGGLRRVDSAIQRIDRSVGAYAAGMNQAFSAVTRGAIGVGSAMIGMAARVEKTNELLGFAFRNEVKAGTVDLAKMNEEIEVVGLRTNMTTQEVRDLTLTMKRMNQVNIFDPNMPKLVDSTGKSLTGLAEVMDDMAAALPMGQTDVFMGLMGLFNGNNQQVRRRLEPIAGHLKEYQRAMAGAKDNAEKMRRIAPLLARDFGGAGARLQTTWSFLGNQIQDVKDKLMLTFGGPLMEQLKGPLRSFIHYFTGPKGILLPDNIKVLDGIKGVFGEIGQVIASAATSMGELARKAFEFTASHPWIVKLAAALAAVVAGFSGLTGVLVGIRFAVMAIGFAFSGILSALLPLTLLVGTLALGSYFLAKWIVGGKSLTDTFKKLGLLTKAAYEAFTHMRGGVATISEGTAKALGNNGLMGVFVKLLKLGYRIRAFFIGIGEGFVSMMGTMEWAFKLMFQAFEDLFGTIGVRFGMTAKTSSDSWRNAGMIIGKVIAGIVTAFALGVGFMVKLVEFLVQALGVLWDVLLGIKDAWDDIVGGTKTAAKIAVAPATVLTPFSQERSLVRQQLPAMPSSLARGPGAVPEVQTDAQRRETYAQHGMDPAKWEPLRFEATIGNIIRAWAHGGLASPDPRDREMAAGTYKQNAESISTGLREGPGLMAGIRAAMQGWTVVLDGEIVGKLQDNQASNAADRGGAPPTIRNGR